MDIIDDKEDLLQRITSILKRQVDPSQHASLKRFVMAFYGYQHLKVLRRLTPERIADGLFRLWMFCQQREADTPKYDVYYLKPASIDTSPERLVIQLVNDNMAFLVASLIHFLNRLGLKPRLVVHPVLYVQRDSAGNLIAIKDKGSLDPNVKEESLIYCEITEMVTPETVKTVLEGLPQTLLEVRQATQDWDAMRRQVREAIKDVEVSRYQGEYVRIEESKDFLRWIEDEHFTFLGYCKYELYGDDGRLLREPRAVQALGILRDEDQRRLDRIFEGVGYSQATRHLIMKPSPLIINKTTQLSLVHRDVPMDVIGVRFLNEAGEVIGLHMFLGLFTSIAYDSSARDIPYLRRKVERVIENAGIEPTWHDGKALIHILDTLPRDELFQASVTELTQIGMSIVRLQVEQRVALFMRADIFKRFMSCLVYVPGDVFDSTLMDKMGAVLARELDGKLGVVKAQFGAFTFARIHFTINTPNGTKDAYNITHIEQQLMEVAKSWSDDLRNALSLSFTEWKSGRLFRLYRNAFTRAYQDRFMGQDVVSDIEAIESIYAEKSFTTRVSVVNPDEPSHIKLKFFHKATPVALSDILPTLENLGLRVISEIPFRVTREEADDVVWIHSFDMEIKHMAKTVSSDEFDRFLQAFTAVYTKQTEDDGFNRLVLAADLTWRQCSLIRAYAHYLKQLGMTYSAPFVQMTLVRHADITRLLVELFEARFDPTCTSGNADLIESILKALDGVDNQDEDRILRRYLNAILSTLRTNYFRTDDAGKIKSFISFKFDCAALMEMPLPRPLYEIYVYAQDVEAVHLRGGRVARGGIRWSDRHEDFRTEVLGLMKAQMVKNSVIVPVGSKGGFIVKKDLDGLSREEIQQISVSCYQTMIRGLLDITDNLVNHEIVPPAQVLRYDGDDPYLVVAADKGTATFSDYANAVSQEYGFWLADAFASGGSAGYDHKKMGITAKGAWESVRKHFRELGLNVDTTDFTVVGIGDMSGDVFGNGMLLSPHIRLVGAFNHAHIFVDPNPDAQKSYLERARLFNLPRSSWADYDPTLLSSGGAIYERRSKVINLTPEIQEMLSLPRPMVSPQDLIRALMTYHTDLLWFGGIGTYVKSSQESNADVGDRNNDALRVNAKDLRCRVIAEGANLGVTHLGRIEFARRLHGRINTDAIDNSAGVDCSDHEVNIKILLGTVMAKNRLDLEKRNALLESMTQNVSELVLRDNYKQNLCLSVMESSGNEVFDQKVRLIRKLESLGRLDRALEYLPDDNTLAEMQTSGRSFVRPELAVLLAYSKIQLYADLLTMDLVKDPFFEGRLLSYFPDLMRADYALDILAHPLRDEIVATIIVNEVVNHMGAAFVYEVQDKTGKSLPMIFKAYFLAMEVFNFEGFFEELESYDGKIDAVQQTRVYRELLKVLKRTTIWLLNHYPLDGLLSDLVHDLSIGVGAFLGDLTDCLDAEGEDKLAQTVVFYQNFGIEHAFAERCALLAIAANSPNIVLLASATGFTMREIGTLYFHLGSRFSFGKIRAQVRGIVTTSTWVNQQLMGLLEDLYNYQSDLTLRVISLAHENPKALEDGGKALMAQFEIDHTEAVARLDRMFLEANIARCQDVATLTVATRELRLLSQS